MRAIIVGGGEAPSKILLERYIDEDSIIIAADGGANALSMYNITPNYLLGDFDSIEGEVYEKLCSNSETTRFPREKDDTDSKIAFEKAIKLGAKEIIFLGCTGKRIDHFMANLCVLHEGLKRSINCYIVDEYNEIFLIDKSSTIYGKSGEVFSLFSYGEDTKGLTLIGAKYPLNNFNLSQVNNLTVSNEFLSEEVSIIFSNGCLLVIKIID